MKRRGARETRSFGAAWPRAGRQGSAGHSRAGAATVGGTLRYRKGPGDALDYLVGYGLSPVLWRKLPGCRSAGRVQSVALLLICEGEAEIEAFAPRAYWTVTGTATATDGATPASGGTSGSGAPFRAELCRLDGAAIDVRRSDCPASSPPRFAPASSTCAAGMDSPCNGIFLRLRMAVMESFRHAAVGGCAAGGRTMKGRGARETRSFGAARPRPGRQGPAGHSRAGAATVGGSPRHRTRPGDTPWRRALKRGAASGSVHSAQRTAGSASHGGRALRRSDYPACSAHRFAPASSTCAAGMDSPCNSIFLRLRMAVMESVRHAVIGGCAAGGRTMKGRGARETRSFGAARSRAGRQGPAGHSRAGAATVEGTLRYRKRPGDTPWRRAPKRGGGRLAGVKGGPGGARRGWRGDPEEIKREKTIDCGEIRVPRDGSGRCRLTRDNCCYRESISGPFSMDSETFRCSSTP